MVFSCTRKTSATSATLRPSPTARMARRYVTWRKLPCWWAVFSRRFIALREYVVRVKRTRHIGTFLQRLYGNDVSLVCMFPMCGGTSTPLQKIFFLKSIVRLDASQFQLPEGAFGVAPGSTDRGKNGNAEWHPCVRITIKCD